MYNEEEALLAFATFRKEWKSNVETINTRGDQIQNIYFPFGLEMDLGNRRTLRFQLQMAARKYEPLFGQDLGAEQTKIKSRGYPFKLFYIAEKPLPINARQNNLFFTRGRFRRSIYEVFGSKDIAVEVHPDANDTMNRKVVLTIYFISIENVFIQYYQVK